MRMKGVGWGCRRPRLIGFLPLCRGHNTRCRSLRSGNASQKWSALATAANLIGIGDHGENTHRSRGSRIRAASEGNDCVSPPDGYHFTRATPEHLIRILYRVYYSILLASIQRRQLVSFPLGLLLGVLARLQRKH
jgi:hypothetical protein